MRLQTALKYSQYFMYKGQKYWTPRHYKKPVNKSFIVCAFEDRDAGKIVRLSSFCYVKPVIRIAGVISNE